MTQGASQWSRCACRTCALPSTLLVFYPWPRQFAFEVILPKFREPNVPSVVFQRPGSEVLIEPLSCSKKLKKDFFKIQCHLFPFFTTIQAVSDKKKFVFSVQCTMAPTVQT